MYLPGLVEIIAFFVIPVLALIVVYQRIRKGGKSDE